MSGLAWKVSQCLPSLLEFVVLAYTTEGNKARAYEKRNAYSTTSCFNKVSFAIYCWYTGVTPM